MQAEPVNSVLTVLLSQFWMAFMTIEIFKFRARINMDLHVANGMIIYLYMLVLTLVAWFWKM